jgi:hypothetical protein
VIDPEFTLTDPDWAFKVKVPAVPERAQFEKAETPLLEVETEVFEQARVTAPSFEESAIELPLPTRLLFAS